MLETVYFGTYTKKESQGIYAADFDSTTGELSDLRLVVKAENPIYLAFSEDDFLYSAIAQGDKGGIASFDQQFTLLNQVLEDGKPPCYVAYDAKRHLVFSANYHIGEVLIYQEEKDGRLTLLNRLAHHDSEPHPNQSSAHIHFASLTPDRFLLTCDSGTDTVICYDLNEAGKLTEIATYQAQTGAGCRHIVFHPFLKIAYLACKLNSTVEVLIYDGYGEFEHYETHSTLPQDYQGDNEVAAIRISPDGRFLYISNHGHDSIAVFKLIGDGQLEILQIISTSGKMPRDFSLTPDNNHLIVVHQESNNATIFKRDQATGLLTELYHDFYVPEAVCITFRKEKHAS